MPKRRGLPDCRRRQYKACGKAAQRGDGFLDIWRYTRKRLRAGYKSLKRHMPGYLPMSVFLA